MWENIIESAMANGIWTLLFCCLFIFQLKDSKMRETKYQETIQKLSDSLAYMKDIDESISQIRDDMRARMDRS